MLLCPMLGSTDLSCMFCYLVWPPEPWPATISRSDRLRSCNFVSVSPFNLILVIIIIFTYRWLLIDWIVGILPNLFEFPLKSAKPRSGIIFSSTTLVQHCTYTHSTLAHIHTYTLSKSFVDNWPDTRRYYTFILVNHDIYPEQLCFCYQLN